MRNLLLPLFFAILINGPIFGQANHWTDIAEASLAADPGIRDVVPNAYRTLHLDVQAIKSQLAGAPQEARFVEGAPGVQLAFPLPEGGFSTFEVWEAPVMAPELTAKYPDIRSYAGRNREGDYIRFSVSPAGLKALVLPVERGNSYSLAPYFRGGVEDYICYARKDVPLPEDQMSEYMEELEPEAAAPIAVGERAGSCGNLRTYRLALACTVEYAVWKGGANPNDPDEVLVLAAMNALLTGVNAIFEIDAGLRMIMVANNDLLMYTDPAADDPYTYGDSFVMLSENQTTCDNVIGTANYDIGHVLGRSPSGSRASFAVVCGSTKAKGVQNSANTFFDDHWVEGMTHMMSRQIGASSTHYWPCSGGVGVEPGSGSTICGTTQNTLCYPYMQPHPDTYFHAYSIGQIVTIINGTGSCAALVPNGNSAPTCNALVNKTIPKSTPFILTATASDPNGDVLSYCWEQMDPKVTPVQPMPPTPTNKNGPVFRSQPPSSSPSRYFPKFADVLNNTNDTWEVLPSVSRALNFRVTIRDNHPDGGCTTEKDIVLTVKSQAGPFVVTQPNTAVNWLGNSTQTVTWDVAGTKANGVNCANVAILLTTDAGVTFTTLLASTPNDGSQAVPVPNIGTTQARILVRAVGNYFYDVSNANFTITAASPFEGGGSNKNAGEKLLVYPNPTTGYVQFDFGGHPDHPYQLTLMDAAGQVVVSRKAVENELDVSELRPGLYFLRIQNGERTGIAKLLKQ